MFLFNGHETHRRSFLKGISWRVLGSRCPGGKCRAAIAKQIWLYSWVEAGMSLSCWMWNRTPEWAR